MTNEDESAALGVPLHSPAFLFERLTRSESGEIVEFVSSIYRGDRYRLVTELSVRPTPRRSGIPSRSTTTASGAEPVWSIPSTDALRMECAYRARQAKVVLTYRQSCASLRAGWRVV